MNLLTKPRVFLMMLLLAGFPGSVFAGGETAVHTPTTPAATLQERLFMDPVGNGLAILALVGMVSVATLTVLRLRRHWSAQLLAVWWFIPVLAMSGFGIAVYLTAVELGPGACSLNAACFVLRDAAIDQFLGFLPLGPLGMVGYGAIFLTWIITQFGAESAKQTGPLVLLLLSAGGFALALYVTVLEPFVIGMTCLWCLVSAVIMTILFWGSAESYHSLRQGERWRRQLNGE